MRNIADEKPTDALAGRTLYSTKFIDDVDIVGKTILDIGCGYGWLELNLVERGCRRVNGLEYKEGDLFTAKKYITNDSILFDTGSAIAIPYEDNYFDTVISFEVIEHIPKNTEEKMFSEVQRVLKNNGKFYISTPNDNFFSKIFDPAWLLIGHRHYDIDYLTELGKKSGFQVKNATIKGGWWEIIHLNDLYLAKWLFHRKPFFQDILKKKISQEYNKEGFYTLFLCFTKIV